MVKHITVVPKTAGTDLGVLPQLMLMATMKGTSENVVFGVEIFSATFILNKLFLKFLFKKLFEILYIFISILGIRFVKRNIHSHQRGEWVWKR